MGLADACWEIQIRADGPWVKVTYGIFRSWSGARRVDGKPFVGPVHTLGDGLPNPWTDEDAMRLAEEEML